MIFLPSGTFRDGFDQNGASDADSGASPPDHDCAGKVRSYILNFFFSFLTLNKGHSKTSYIRTCSTADSSTSGTSLHLCVFGYAGTAATSPDL